MYHVGLINHIAEGMKIHFAEQSAAVIELLKRKSKEKAKNKNLKSI